MLFRSSGQSDASRSSIDLPSGSSSSGHGHGNSNGHVRSLSNVRNGLPAHPAPEGRSNHQRTATAMALSYSAPNSAATHIHASSSNSNGNSNTPRAQITVTSPENNTNTISKLAAKADTSELVRRRLQEAVVDATKRGATHVKLNMEFISAIVMLLDQRRDEFNDMNRRLDGFKVRVRFVLETKEVSLTCFSLSFFVVSCVVFRWVIHTYIYVCVCLACFRGRVSSTWTGLR